MALAPLSWLSQSWQVVRRLDRLVESDRKQADALEKLEARVASLEQRVIELRADQERLVTEARSAATAASSATLSQLAMEVGMLKARLPNRICSTPSVG